MGKYWEGCSMWAVIIGCVVYCILLSRVCVVCGLVFLTPSWFSKGFLFSDGVYWSEVPIVCVCVCLCLLGLAYLVYLQDNLTNVEECREGKLIWHLSLFYSCGWLVLALEVVILWISGVLVSGVCECSPPSVVSVF